MCDSTSRRTVIPRAAKNSKHLGCVEPPHSSSETLIACEKETWNLIQRKDLQGFGRYLADEFYDIFPDGPQRTKSELLEFLSRAELKNTISAISE